ncbi:hypothetical protein KC711_07610 [Candidatus Peregrinibacteria bacterium]|nr:hypothetical protein [Candidatus Peregrinibacteria bacterium]
MAMSGSESIGMTGSGNIDASLNNTGTIRHRDSDCYDVNGTKLISCSGGSVAQELEYFWEDTHTTIGDFIGDMTDAYVMIYNSDPATSPSRTINIMADSPFALPVYTLEAVSKKNDALQVYRFTEDKSKYLDALKYGIYNN